MDLQPGGGRDESTTFSLLGWPCDLPDGSEEGRPGDYVADHVALTSRIERSLRQDLAVGAEPLRWSWARDRDEADGFQAEASRLVGQVLSEVKYVDLDYSEEHRGQVVGPRLVSAASEWAQSPWRHRVGDDVGHAVEFRTVSGSVFTASWESPGEAEGIGLRACSAIGAAVVVDGNVAVWDVSSTPRWRRLIGKQIDSVDLRYEAWDDCLWCQRIDLGIGAHRVGLHLAEVGRQSGELAPSSDNIVVTFDPDAGSEAQSRLSDPDDGPRAG